VVFGIRELGSISAMRKVNSIILRQAILTVTACDSTYPLPGTNNLLQGWLCIAKHVAHRFWPTEVCRNFRVEL